MSTLKSSLAASRINIPISSETKDEMESLAVANGVSLAELCRRAIEGFLAEARRRRRLEQLRNSAVRNSAILDGVAEEWRSTELDGWSDEEH